MSDFIGKNKGLIGLLGVCLTYIGGRIIQTKHYERVNAQRISSLEAYYQACKYGYDGEPPVIKDEEDVFMEKIEKIKKG